MSTNGQGGCPRADRGAVRWRLGALSTSGHHKKQWNNTQYNKTQIFRKVRRHAAEAHARRQAMRTVASSCRRPLILMTRVQRNPRRRADRETNIASAMVRDRRAHSRLLLVKSRVTIAVSRPCPPSHAVPELELHVQQCVLRGKSRHRVVPRQCSLHSYKEILRV